MHRIRGNQVVRRSLESFFPLPNHKSSPNLLIYNYRFRVSKPFICSKVMAAEIVLKLLDTYWFETSIFTNKTPSPLHPTLDSTSHLSHNMVEVLSLDTKMLLRVPTLQVRSFTDEYLGSKMGAFSDSLSPNSVLITPQKLQPILSGKEVTSNHEAEEEEASTKKKLSHRHSHRTRLRKGEKTSKSMSDLEFKELKGFMDLGFVFSEEDKDSRLVSLIPGLQWLGRDDIDAGVRAEQQNIDHETVIYSRPYLSEAWGFLDQRKVVNPLLNRRVPSVLGNEIDMKDKLRFWAHTVASIAR